MIRRSVLALALAVSVASLAACSSITTGQPTVGYVDGASGVQGAASESPEPTVSCPAKPATLPNGVDQTVTSGGLPRTYVIAVPPNYDATKPVPVVVNYHGTGGDPRGHDTFSNGFAAQATARGYIVLTPQAAKGNSNVERWTVPGFGATPDDIAFTNAMLDQVATQFCVDTKRTFATGFSSGGAMSTWIACTDNARFAAVGPGGGINLVNPNCPHPPIPVYAFHGTKDEIASFVGLGQQPTEPFSLTGAYIGPVEATMDVWAKNNGCQVQRTDQPLAADVTLRTYPGCAAATQLLLVKDGGHTWPGSAASAATTAGGKTTLSVDMTKLLLDFFDTQKKA